MTTQFETLLADFGKTIGIEDLIPDEGYCCLFFDDIVVNLEEREELLFLYTTVGTLPDKGRTRLYTALLEANCFFKETQGATLGADQKAGIVMLSFQAGLNGLTRAAFEKTIENFIMVAETWQSKISDLCRETTEANTIPTQGIMV